MVNLPPFDFLAKKKRAGPSPFVFSSQEQVGFGSIIISEKKI
jgi:hypothetical protein